MGEQEDSLERGFLFSSLSLLSVGRGLLDVRGYRNFEDLDIIRVRDLPKLSEQTQWADMWT